MSGTEQKMMILVELYHHQSGRRSIKFGRLSDGEVKDVRRRTDVCEPSEEALRYR